MNFQNTDDRRMLADTLDRFIRDKYPFATRDKIAKSPQGFSREIWQELAELGVIGALFSEGDGGFGGAGFDIAVVFESLGRGLIVEPFLGAVLAGRAIAAGENGAQKQWVEKIIAGDSIAAFAHDEPDAHYALAHVKTSAKQAGSDWILNGAKAVVQHGESADVFVVSSRNSGGVEDEAGICLFLVPADAKGASGRGSPPIAGVRAAELTLQDVKLPADALLGAPGAGFATIENAVGAGIVALCAEALGAMDEAKKATLEYLQTRKQFGMFIGRLQELPHRIAKIIDAKSSHTIA